MAYCDTDDKTLKHYCHSCAAVCVVSLTFSPYVTRDKCLR